MRWHYRDPLLIWLLPAAYACHILEEWFGGFPEWIALVIGSPMPRVAFIVINAIAMALIVTAARGATRRESNGWMGIAIATILLVNAFAHLGGSLRTGVYSPGLFTSVVLYLPISALVLLRARSQATRSMIVGGIAAGVALHALVFVLAAIVSSEDGKPRATSMSLADWCQSSDEAAPASAIQPSS